MTPFEIITLVLAAAALLAAVVCVVLLLGLKKNAGDNGTAEEFRRNREEQAAGLRAFSRETNERLDRMQTAVNDSARRELESRAALSEKITRSLQEISDREQQSSARQMKFLGDSLAKMQESNEKKLEEMRATVDEKLTATLTTRLDSSFKTVSEQLQNVYTSLGEMKELSQGVTTNVSTLNKVLTNVKARGSWAEVQLEGILDQTIPGRYVKNYSPKNNGERVEFAVRFPSSSGDEIYLPIDSKFPMEDYIRVCDAADRGDVDALQAARKALADRIKSEAKDVKKYIFVPKTTPFAILYLATEGLYAEISSSKDGLAEALQAQNVMIAGPTTITAMLTSFAMGFRAIDINEKADEIRKLLGAAKTQYDKFGDVLEKARKKINEAGTALDDARDRNRLIQKTLRNVEAVPADGVLPELAAGSETPDEE